jgi:NAD(P)-dependent dehydrogenase (short-subunit alcohol dehydrogenase family)
MTALIESLGVNPSLAGIVNLWPLNASSRDAADKDNIQQQLASSASALQLIQACVRLNVSVHHRFCLVTERAQALTGDTLPLNLAQSMLWGIGMTATLEHPELKTTCIDLPSLEAQDAVEHLWHAMHLKQDEWRLAYRGKQGFVARMSRARDVGTVEQTPLTLSEQVTYVVTGATGGLGLATASWLVEHGARRLLLLSRNPLSVDAQHSINLMIEQDAVITHQIVDVADRQALKHALQATQHEGARKLGIVHCAGVLDDHLLIDLEWKHFESSNASKVLGTLNLHELTLELELDCFVMFSSAASLLGNRGQANYAAANCFMDAMAQQRRLAGLPSLSINWGPWGAVGMAQSDSRITKQLAAQGLIALEPQLAFQALGACWLGERSQVGVIDCQWEQYLQSADHLQSFLTKVVTRSLGSPKEQQQQSAQLLLLEQLTAATPALRLKLLSSLVDTQVRKILGLADAMPVPEDQPLTEQGFDSLMAVQLTNAVGRMVGQRLPVSLVFNYPSPKALSLHLFELINTQLVNSESGAEKSSVNPASTNSSDQARSLLDDLDKLLEQT